MEGLCSHSPGMSPELSPMKKVERLIHVDSKEHFTHFLKNQWAKSNENTPFSESELLKLVCKHRAVGCATALLGGETGLTVDVNVTWEDGLSPLQHAAQNLSFGLTELLLQHGSCNNDGKKDLSTVPLSMALKAIRNHQYVADWGPGKSIYKLLYIFSLLELREPLKTISLLASKTEHLNEISLYFVKHGEVTQFAALLMVAWDNLMAPFIEKGVEGSPIGEHVWGQIEIVNNRELEAMIACRPSCECLLFLKTKKTNLIAQWKLLKFLEKGRDVIEKYRHSDRVEAITNHYVPFDVGHDLLNAGFVLHPDDVYSDDIKCLLPKLEKERKEWLNKAIEEKLRSSSFLGTASATGLFINRFKEEDEDISELSHWQHITLTLRQDNKDQFVKLINNWTPMEASRYSSMARALIYSCDSVVCAAAVLDGETAGIFNLTSGLSYVGANALIEAARHSAPQITALLLNTESVADAPCSEDTNLKYRALITALHSTRDAFRELNWTKSNSAVKFLIIICSDQMRRRLETLRLLAYNTKEVKHVFFNYLKEGQMVEVGALLLVASELLFSSSTSQEEDDFSFKNFVEMRRFLLANKPFSPDESKNEVMGVEQLFTLLEIFDKIGDKLAAYIRLDDDSFEEGVPYSVKLEVPSLLEDAGFHVTIKDTVDSTIFSLDTPGFSSTMTQRAPIGECDHKIYDTHMLPSWWMRNRALPYLGGMPSDHLSHLPQRLFSTAPFSNRKSACLSPTKRLATAVRCWNSQNRIAWVVAALRKGLRHV